MAIVELPLLTSTPVFTTRERASECRKYLAAFGAISDKLKGEPSVTRFVDLDSGPGWFAAFAGVRFPYAWIDCYAWPLAEPDAEERLLAKMNAQVGTRFFTEMPETVPECDALHLGPNAKGLVFGGESLEKLQIAIVEWNDSETLENATGLMRAIGLEVAAVGMFEVGSGWSMYIRAGESKIPIHVDLTRKAGAE